ncbi:MAG: hypothetical protein AAF717_03565 [Bacteroidota bacterium]
MKRTIKIFSVLLLCCLAFSSCNSDDDDNSEPDPMTQPDPDPDPDADADELASGWLTGWNLTTPQGRVWYLRVDEAVPTTFDVTSSVELGFNQRPYSFGDNAYVWDSDARTFTKWEVDRTDLSLTPVGIMSLASTGFQSFAAWPTFISETQAFVTNLTEGLIIEWNPSDMTITEVFQVEPLLPFYENSRFFGDATSYVGNGKIIISIAQFAPDTCCEIDTSEMGATAGVFDIATKTFEYVKDTRLISGNIRYARDEGSGFLYVYPNDDQSWIAEYFDYDTSAAPSPHTILRLNGDGTFDPNFELDLDELLNIETFGEVVFAFDNKIVLFYWDSEDGELPESYEDRQDIFNDVSSRTVVVDLETREVSEFTALDKYDFISFFINIEGFNYYIAFSSVESAFDTSFIVRQDAVDTFTELGTYSGAAAAWVDKLWGD